MILIDHKPCTVTATTPDGRVVWCDLVAGWLILGWEPMLLDHGPHIQDVYRTASLDPQLSDVTINEFGERP